MFNIGDKVKITNVHKIYLAELFFQNGDITEVTDVMKNEIFIKTKDEKVFELPVYENEYQYLEKIDT